VLVAVFKVMMRVVLEAAVTGSVAMLVLLLLLLLLVVVVVVVLVVVVVVVKAATVAAAVFPVLLIFVSKIYFMTCLSRSGTFRCRLLEIHFPKAITVP